MLGPGAVVAPELDAAVADRVVVLVEVLVEVSIVVSSEGDSSKSIAAV